MAQELEPLRDSTEDAPTHSDALPSPLLGPSDEYIDRFQARVEGLVGPALDTLYELCTMADSEGVRLNAANSIIMFAGLRAPTRRYTKLKDTAREDEEEGTARELALLLEKLDKNRPGIIDEVASAAREELARTEIIDADVVDEGDA